MGMEIGIGRRRDGNQSRLLWLSSVSMEFRIFFRKGKSWHARKQEVLSGLNCTEPTNCCITKVIVEGL